MFIKYLFSTLKYYFIDVVLLMYYACAHSYYHTEPWASAWCHLFTFKDLQVKNILVKIIFFGQNY